MEKAFNITQISFDKEYLVIRINDQNTGLGLIIFLKNWQRQMTRNGTIMLFHHQGMEFIGLL